MASARHFAVLIGVDFYIREPLSSCVRDVDLVEAYLETLRQKNRFNLLHITKLTASKPASQASDLQKPPESDEALATLQNIKETLSRVASEAVKGDHVYVHYSGHGTVMRDGELALVPFGCEDGVENPLRDCLAGKDLANFLNKAVVKGVKVLLALDCCFSGKISRHNQPDAVRYLPFVPRTETGGVEMLRPYEAGQGVFRSDNATFRGTTVLADWLMDPKGYTILTACGPAQTTHGLRFADGKLHGALTYVLVRALQKLGALNMSHMVVFKIICAMFVAMASSQIPQLKGSGDFTFFGELHGPDDCFFPIIKLSNGQIILQAGEIMGVHENDKLVIAPLSAFASEKWDHEHGLATARNVGGVTAEVKLEVGGGSGEHGQPSQEENVLLPPGYTEATAPVKATVNGLGGFEIRDREGRAIDFDALSLLPAHSTSARSQVIRVLAYLARYHDIVQLKPLGESETLRNAVDVGLFRESGASFPDIQVVDVVDGEVLQLLIINKGEQSIYVNVFCLAGNWEIQNNLTAENTVLSSQKHAESEEDFTADIRFKMMVPEESILRGIHSCEDIFKVFLTTRQVPLADLAAVKPLLRGSPAKWEDDLRDSWLARTFHVRTSYNPDIAVAALRSS
ncbi:hypothetical protein M406DRAFT_334152 [Cryphonectria parasitica EP155]|uniref:Peptidase C14 caspase domain-containing protein n=1 Tax=Cryphonectria parasitica (strain ATCC 38755 / EP155) TaxID=660469 RepID=A0A9P5CI49_CRYP1|nr:uncharacterized protein M406DRAFT_334152 [Cryphonectria parasitica EP155]KAF3760519.1 hypothetical protein M406DRAFT_334152 [Cryphonectria parasitica EP155]